MREEKTEKEFADEERSYATYMAAYAAAEDRYNRSIATADSMGDHIAAHIVYVAALKAADTVRDADMQRSPPASIV